MPLQKPLRKSVKKAAKRKRVDKVMHELKHSPVTAPSRKATSGKQRQRQNVAIALKNAGLSKKRKARRKRT